MPLALPLFSQEPPKAALLAYENSPSEETRPPRQAFVILHTPPESGVIEVVVQLTPEQPHIVSWNKVGSGARLEPRCAHLSACVCLRIWYCLYAPSSM